MIPRVKRNNLNVVRSVFPEIWFQGLATPTEHRRSEWSIQKNLSTINTIDDIVDRLQGVVF